jgi:hypothetical protein
MFNITAVHDTPNVAGRRVDLYVGAKTLAAAKKALERMRRKHTASFVDYRIERDGKPLPEGTGRMDPGILSRARQGITYDRSVAL